MNRDQSDLHIDELLADPFGDIEIPKAEAVKSEKQQVRLVDVLPEENKEKAIQLAGQIDHKNMQSIVLYGSQAQSKLLNFSHTMIDHVQKKDVGEIGEILGELMKKLEQVNPDDLQSKKKGFLARMFGRVSNSLQEVLSKYQKTSVQIDRISLKLEHSKNALISDNKLLEQLYEKNKEYFTALNVYIAAGDLKLEELRTKTIPELKQQAESSEHNQMAVQEVNDLIQFADRLDKRVHDLLLSRQITIQSAPQIRLIQNTNQALAEKIQSSIVTAIPLWKNQVAIALTLLRQRNAVDAQQKVADTTNELLLKNAELLKTNTIETVRANERGLVDIDTLKKVQESLISTLEETLTIQEEGRIKRRQAEEELMMMEGDLKQKLLTIKER
ncbi:toxic anion resistance protein [Bacillus inaquosorum]|uniref:toxic anion resistance protein n=1 Tax=Bacillus inaquosorum TaxID=483913 RepID=UPI00227F5601|nr:toxic anion resistance protein [Bacillus inaquosorum]MCY7981127.1 toxic anion resistance protein [Bacillus inaquosorum]MCY8754608.1 toxic anion resistance protein [Bacillus inaquosorum]MCY9344429.1 toxic anion resistance protein [Bacillus inaquosorum]MEC0680962.1 toxic anion resistance protein [Bacillus inaquosorum]MEC3625372.1 toxic anion resistance protein [Bacillus inaquosorum]